MKRATKTLENIYLKIVYYLYKDTEDFMGRTKGSKNKVSNIRPATCDLTTDQRLQLIANLVIDYIAYDQANGTKLLIRIQKEVICSQ